MAIAFAGERGAAQGVTGSGIHTVAISPSRTCIAGNLLVLFVASNGSAPASNVYDSLGNKWTTGKEVVNGALIDVYTSVLAYGLDPTDTIFVDFVGSFGTITYSYLLEEFSGMLSGDIDASAISTAAAFNVGPTGVTSQASELCVAVFSSSSVTSISMNAPYTTFPTTFITGGNATMLVAGYNIVAATGTQSAAATSTGSGLVLIRGILTTYRGGVAAPEQIPPPPLITR